MLIRFTIDNWLSFAETTELSMVASPERQHNERVARVKSYAKILPMAAVYGGNASGKTNFFQALNFVQRLVVHGRKPDSPIPVTPFLLDPEKPGAPSSFTLEICVDGTFYEYGFTLTHKEVLKEHLIRIGQTTERVLFQREGRTVEFHRSLPEQKYLQFVARGTRENQLFLTNSVFQNLQTFEAVYIWFKDHLEMVAPDARFELFEILSDKDSIFSDQVNTLLEQMDTGIKRLDTEEVAFKDLPFSAAVKSQIQEELQEGKTLRIDGSMNARFLVSRKQGEIRAKKLISYHHAPDGGEVRFELSQESDGSQRLIDLLPAFVSLMAADCTKVFVIDELDRSLHSLLTKKLLELYLESCSPETRKQLILTTHDLSLMDQSLLRRDEMWVTQRKSDGSSQLFSFSEFKDVRYDKDIRKSYLQGRLGGVPVLDRVGEEPLSYDPSGSKN
ncbi:MAG: ATP-binding protein [Candidatus Hydrogenedens sp.]|jgi:AAA15 family ATPase/GTPase|nr:ATP-binding protein [Candidatus Hydrogenedens sp.]